MKDILHEASCLAEHWRQLYARTGHVKYLRTAETLSALRAAIVDHKTSVHADSTAKPFHEATHETGAPL